MLCDRETPQPACEDINSNTPALVEREDAVAAGKLLRDLVAVGVDDGGAVDAHSDAILTRPTLLRRIAAVVGRTYRPLPTRDKCRIGPGGGSLLRAFRTAIADFQQLSLLDS